MLALVAAVLFVVAAIKQGHADSALFWVFLALAAWALHFAVDTYWRVPLGRRGAPPP